MNWRLSHFTNADLPRTMTFRYSHPVPSWAMGRSSVNAASTTLKLTVFRYSRACVVVMRRYRVLYERGSG